MLRFEADVLATDLRSRTIEGVIVPYNEVGVIAGREYRFRPGSLKLARSRTPLLVDHDRARPIGVLAELVDGPTGPIARFSIDETPDGDHALIQAASGSRGSLSIGAEVDRSRIDAAGVIEVEAGAVHEVSLLALGAFTGATVLRVAAEAEEPELEPDAAEPDENQTELELEDDDEPDDTDDAGAAGDPEPEEGSSMEAASAAPVIITAGADRPHQALQAGELVALLVRAQHGEPDAQRMIAAALTESISTDVSGLLPPQYEKAVIGGKAVLRPLYETFRSRPIPGVGLLVSKPAWTTRPDGAWAATVNDDAHTTKVVIGSQTADVARWDWAGAIPWVVVQRSDPSIVDEIYGEAVEDFYLDVEAKIYAELSAANPGAATTLGGAIAEFFVSSGNQRAPEVIIMAPDVWGDFADVGALSTPTGQGGVEGSSLSTSFAGIRAITSGTLPPGETVLATRRAVDARTTEPVRLTANAIGALNVELAVVGEGLFDTDYPAELLKFAAIAPAAPAATSSSRSSKS